MAKRNEKSISLPAYATVNRSGNAFYLDGYRQHFLGSSFVYLPRPSFVRSSRTINVTDDSPISDFERIDSLQDNVSDNRSFFMKPTGVPYEYDARGDTVRPVEYEFVAPDARHFSFSFEGKAYIIDEEWNIYRSVNANVPIELETVTTNLREQISTLNLADSLISDVVVWQNRLWIALDNTIVWCDTNNIAEWRPEYVDDEGANLTTNAGFQTILERGGIKKLAPEGRHFYIFLDNEVYSTEILDSDEQFGFTPLVNNFEYVAGGVETYAGLIVVSTTGLFVVRAGEATIVSKNIANHITDFHLGGPPSVTFIDNTVMLRNEELELSFDFEEGITQITNVGASLYGELTRTPTTVGDIDEEIGDIDSEIGSLGGDAGLDSACIFADGGIGLKALLPTNKVRFNLEQNFYNERSNISYISVPELEDYSIRVKNHDDLDWGDELSPDRFGIVRVNKVFKSPDIEISSALGEAISYVSVNSRLVKR